MNSFQWLRPEQVQTVPQLELSIFPNLEVALQQQLLQVQHLLQRVAPVHSLDLGTSMVLQVVVKQGA